MRRSLSRCRWLALIIQALQSSTLKTSTSTTFPAQMKSPTPRYCSTGPIPHDCLWAGAHTNLWFCHRLTVLWSSSSFLDRLRQRRKMILMACLRLEEDLAATITLWVFLSYVDTEHSLLPCAFVCLCPHYPFFYLSGAWGTDGFLALVRSCWGRFRRGALPILSHHAHVTTAMCGVGTTAGWERGQVRLKLLPV